MIGMLWILAATVVAGLVLYLLDRRAKSRPGYVEPEPKVPADRPEGCCGQHVVCQKEAIIKAASEPVVYYEDEDLDQYCGVPSDGYTEEQIEQFRDVLYTLRPEEIGGWAQSIQMRGILLPSPVKDELIMLAAEAASAASGGKSAPQTPASQP